MQLVALQRGFINRHRVVLTLSYTHDEVPLPPQRDAEDDAGCVDSLDYVANDGQGNRLRCADVAQHCAEYDALRTACPRTCGVCGGGGGGGGEGWDDEQLSAVAAWKPLEFANLPGDPARAPKFNSPYHHRLDWEVWIHTTASMEREAEIAETTKKAASAAAAAAAAAAGGGTSAPLPPPRLRELQVPRFVQTLAAKVLAGDTDAISLTGTPAVGTLLLLDDSDDTTAAAAASTAATASTPVATSRVKKPLRPPKAIRADYWTYRFSTWEEWRSEGVWWVRERLSKPTVYRDVDVVLPRRERVRRSPWQRPWVLLLAVAGGVATAAAALTIMFGGPRVTVPSNPSSHSYTAPAAAPLIARVPAAAVAAMRHVAGALVAPLAPAALCHAACFYLTLVADYPEWRLLAVDAIPTWALLGLPSLAGFAAAALIDALLVEVEGGVGGVRRVRGAGRNTVVSSLDSVRGVLPARVQLTAAAAAVAAAEAVMVAAAGAGAGGGVLPAGTGVFTRAARVTPGHEYAGIFELSATALALGAARAGVALWRRGRGPRRGGGGVVNPRHESSTGFGGFSGLGFVFGGGVAELLGSFVAPASMLVMASRAATLQDQLRAVVVG
jgi:hypothetical protein